MAADSSKIDLSKIRNLGVIAHIDAGKTTTTEHLLYYAGAKHKLGGVDEGTTETDFDPEEQERGITIYSACIPFHWLDCTINLIDTPGHVDFTAEVERSLRVLDGCVVVFDAQKGVEAQSETVWRQADKYQVPRLVFINKMDVVGANFENAVAEVRERLEGNPVPLQIPIGAGSIKDGPTPFIGVIDLLEMQALYFETADHGKTIRREPIPEELLPNAQRWRTQLLDVLSEKDGVLAEAYMAELDGQEQVGPKAMRGVIRRLTLERSIQPVLCGSGREHIGIQPLMDACCWYLPSPLDRPAVVGINPKKDKEEKRKPDPKEPFCGLVFKIVADRNAELFYIRIYSGTLKSQSRVFNSTRDHKELLSKLYHTFADPTQRKELPEAYAGDIVAVLGLKESITGDTLCETAHPLLLEKITFAEAVVSQSIEPETSADRQKMESILNLLRREDPTFTWRIDRDTGQTLMTGMGTLHLEIKRHRMERDFKLKLRVGKPRVSYRETLKNAIRVEGECIRQAGQGNLFAKLTVEFTPFKPEKGVESVVVRNHLKPDVLTPLLTAAAVAGLRGALDSGEVGYPVVGVQATITEAEMEEQTSNETAFQAAAADAVRKAMRENVVLLEPVMKLEVTVPDDYLGDVTGDLNRRRAEINEVMAKERSKLRIVEAIVPLSKMFDYAEQVRSLSQGRASWSMEPHEYAPAPPEVLRGMLHPEDGY
jgi:elongation factor G